MAVLIRVKRRLEDGPAEALFSPSSFKKLKGQDGNMAKNQVFSFCGTVDKKVTKFLICSLPWLLLWKCFSYFQDDFQKVVERRSARIDGDGKRIGLKARTVELRSGRPAYAERRYKVLPRFPQFIFVLFFFELGCFPCAGSDESEERGRRVVYGRHDE